MFGFFNKSDFILSAPVKGQLFDDGKPVANTKVMRSLTYGDEYIDATVTDEQGYFTFSEKTIKTSKPANMFDNDSLVQHIYLENGTPEGIVLWYTLVSLHENSQTLKRLLADLECDILKSQKHTIFLSKKIQAILLRFIHHVNFNLKHLIQRELI